MAGEEDDKRFEGGEHFSDADEGSEDTVDTPADAPHTSSILHGESPNKVEWGQSENEDPADPSSPATELGDELSAEQRWQEAMASWGSPLPAVDPNVVASADAPSAPEATEPNPAPPTNAPDGPATEAPAAPEPWAPPPPPANPWDAPATDPYAPPAANPYADPYAPPPANPYADPYAPPANPYAAPANPYAPPAANPYADPYAYANPYTDPYASGAPADTPTGPWTGDEDEEDDYEYVYEGHGDNAKSGVVSSTITPKSGISSLLGKLELNKGKLPGWVIPVAGVALAIVLALLFSVAFGGGDSGPSKALQGFWKAANAGDIHKAHDYLCTAQASKVSEDDLAKQLSSVGKVTVAIETVGKVTPNGDIKQVLITEKLTNLKGEVANTTAIMANEGNGWKYCGNNTKAG